MALASSTTTAAALTVRLDPELVAPSLQPSKPCLSCCCTLDRPEKRPGATLFAGNCTSSVLCAWRHIFKTGWYLVHQEGGAGAGTKCKGLWLEGNQEAGSSWRCRLCTAEGCMRHSFRPAQPLQAGARSKRPFEIRSLLFSVLNIGLVLMINLPN